MTNHFKKLWIKDLNYDFLSRLKLKGVGNQHIPLFDDYLKAINSFDINVTIVPDIKDIAPQYFDKFFVKLENHQQKHKVKIKTNITGHRWGELGSKGRSELCKNIKKPRANFNNKKIYKKCKKISAI